MPDGLKTIPEACTAKIKIRRSTFLATVAPVDTPEAAKEFISEIQNEYPKARHHCWAYITGSDGQTLHCSDAGEPSGSAGRPILNTLRRHELTNVVAVVARWFGGVKLGIRGLIEAYGSAVDEALKDGRLIAVQPVEPVCSYWIEIPYEHSNDVLRQLEGFKPRNQEHEYTDIVTVWMDIAEQKSDHAEELLQSLRERGFVQDWELVSHNEKSK